MRRRFSNSGRFSAGAPEYRRIVSLVFLLALIGVMINWARKPENWKWLASERGATVVVATTALEEPGTAPRRETVEPGPTDLDPQEKKSVQMAYEVIKDRAPLSVEEMSAYWKFMGWTRHQSFAEMLKRARKDLLFVHLWEQPEKYRGELIELRVHLRRILSHDAPANNANVKTVYEAWGPTDDSKSYPYVLVMSELPDQMPMGAKIEEEGVFVGYFLKNLAYEAFNARRAAPLLVGRLQRIAPRPSAVRSQKTGWVEIAVVAGLALAIIAWTVFIPRRSTQRRRTFSNPSGTVNLPGPDLSEPDLPDEE
ncbi:MAG: hypothetical protein U0903_00460 [Planctomycetales bacterium]